ncbi:hypothetical protein A2U01_0022754 [Trifolium medium]|uniref:Uncharacterized protein n=1 Tax=Trifolium medium TaxID=97028 RepID=A0A392NPD8_9FABA|nr:hypothetical protein [Trifolium medium]
MRGKQRRQIIINSSTGLQPGYQAVQKYLMLKSAVKRAKMHYQIQSSELEFLNTTAMKARLITGTITTISHHAEGAKKELKARRDSRTLKYVINTESI